MFKKKNKRLRGNQQEGCEMKVKKWISYDEANGYNEAPCGGIGGFFQDSMRFNDYITTFKKKPTHTYWQFKILLLRIK